MLVNFEAHFSEETRLPRRMEMTLYRIVQESLTNILKHAHARQVRIKLEYQPDQVNLVVDDNGKGFDALRLHSALNSNGKLGLLGMHERVALLGGTIDVRSAYGAGTAIRVRIPLREDLLDQS